MRLNKMTAAVYMTCQGTLFFLSGEEFARTKDGQDNTFKDPISLNRLDWEILSDADDSWCWEKGVCGKAAGSVGKCNA